MKTSLFHKGQGSLPERIFFRACKMNISGIYSSIGIDPTLQGNMGLFIALENGSSDVAIELLRDKRQKNIEVSWMILSIQKGLVDVVSIILYHPLFDIHEFLALLPIRVYDEEKKNNHQDIVFILQSHIEFKNKVILNFGY